MPKQRLPRKRFLPPQDRFKDIPQITRLAYRAGGDVSLADDGKQPRQPTAASLSCDTSIETLLGVVNDCLYVLRHGAGVSRNVHFL
jgi:hypothetical protein